MTAKKDESHWRSSNGGLRERDGMSSETSKELLLSVLGKGVNPE
jgi:hypothetical protein